MNETGEKQAFVNGRYKFRKESWHKFIIHLLLIIGSLVMIIPFIWMVLTAFKTYAESIKIPIIWFPKAFSFNNFISVISNMNFGKYYINTIIVTVAITIGQAFICSLAAYAFARMNFPLKNALFIVVLSVLMVPTQMTLIPKFLMVSRMGMADTLAGIIVPNLFSSFGTFFLRQFFLTLPTELEDAATIDGCSYFRTFWNIMLPLCSSGIAAFVIFTVLWAWNDLLWPLVVTSSDSMRVLSVGIAALQGEYATDYTVMMAACVMAILPMLLLFIAGQKKFIAGIATTGIK
jgi:ABC-type sugar transport system, permease component